MLRLVLQLEPHLRRYGAPLAACVAALLASLLLGRITPTAPFPLFLTAVAFSTWCGGLPAGLLATSLSLLGIGYFFEAPVYSLAITELSTAVNLGVFVGAALVINGLHERLRDAQGKVEAARGEAETLRWLEFLSEASTVLAESFDKAVTLQTAAVLAIRELADWCVIDILKEDGTPLRRTLAHKRVDREALLNELQGCYGPVLNLILGVTEVQRTRRPLLQEAIADSALMSAARDPDRIQPLRELGFRSSICVPLLSRGHMLGTITLVAGEDSPRYGPIHLKKAEDLAGRVALAVENARLHRLDIERARLDGALSAVRGIERSLNEQLASVRAFAALLENDAQLPGHLRKLVGELLRSAEATGQSVERLRIVGNAQKLGRDGGSSSEAGSRRVAA